jgi:tetratricopeptide (TPR) repeat protein
MLHPLTIKYVGRWLNLKRTTGNKGFDEILTEIKNSLNISPMPETPVDVLYAVLDQAIAPLVKGKKSNTIRLCFASFHAVFSPEFCQPSVPLEVANEFFLSVVESTGDYLSEDGELSCPLYKSHGKQTAKLVPEILGAMGIFNITKHSTKEKTIQIDHEVIRRFGDYVLKNKAIQLVVNQASLKKWHQAHAKEYFDQYNWNDLQPDRSQSYALQHLPRHMLKGEMFDSIVEILSNKTFIKGRLSMMGLIKGVDAQLKDVESFWNTFNPREECGTMLLPVYEAMESVLMRKLDGDKSSSGGGASVLEVGQCLHLIGTSLGRIGLLDAAVRYCNKCVELIYDSKTSEEFASLLHDTSALYLDLNKFESAKETADLVLDMRAKLFGDGHVLYARSVRHLGIIAFQESDYIKADSHFKKSIKIFAPSDHLDLAIVHLKLGRCDHEGGFFDDALKCYNQSSEFAEKELPVNHEFFVNIYYQMANSLLQKGSILDASYAFQRALTLSNKVRHKSHDLVILVHLIEAALHGINHEHEKAIVKYRDGLDLARRFAYSNKRLAARIMLLIGKELNENNDTIPAIEIFHESIGLMKKSIGSMHLDVADALVNVSSIEDSDGKVRTMLGTNLFIDWHCLQLFSFFAPYSTKTQHEI